MDLNVSLACEAITLCNHRSEKGLDIQSEWMFVSITKDLPQEWNFHSPTSLHLPTSIPSRHLSRRLLKGFPRMCGRLARSRSFEAGKRIHACLALLNWVMKKPNHSKVFLSYVASTASSSLKKVLQLLSCTELQKCCSTAIDGICHFQSSFVNFKFSKKSHSIANWSRLFPETIQFWNRKSMIAMFQW